MKRKPSPYAVPPDLEEAIAFLIALVEDEQVRDLRDLAETLFWGNWETALEPEELHELSSDPSVQVSFVLGTAIDLKSLNGRSLVEAVLPEVREEVGAQVRRHFPVLARTHIDLYRIEKVSADGTVELTGLYDREKRRTTRVSEELTEGDVAAARLYPPDAEHAATLDLYSFPAEFEDELRSTVEAELRALADVASAEGEGDVSMRDYLDQSGLRFHSLWLEVVSGVEPLEPGEEGEVLLVSAVAPVVRALDRCEELEVAGDDLWRLGQGPEEVTIELDTDALLVGGDDDRAVEQACALLLNLAPEYLERLEPEPLDPAELGIEEEL